MHLVHCDPLFILLFTINKLRLAYESVCLACDVYTISQVHLESAINLTIWISPTQRTPPRIGTVQVDTNRSLILIELNRYIYIYKIRLWYLQLIGLKKGKTKNIKVKRYAECDWPASPVVQSHIRLWTHSGLNPLPYKRKKSRVEASYP